MIWLANGDFQHVSQQIGAVNYYKNPLYNIFIKIKTKMRDQ